MRRVVLAVVAVVLLVACQPPAELEVPALPRPWDLFTDGTASATLQRLSEAAGSDQVLDVTMRRDSLRATFQTPSGPRPFRVSQDETSPTPNPPVSSTDIDPFTQPIPLSTINLDAIGAQARPVLKNCTDDYAVVSVSAAGPAQSTALAHCGGDWRLRMWLPDLQPAALDVSTPLGLTDAVWRLNRGWDEGVSSVSVEAGDRPEVSLVRPESTTTLESTANPHARWQTAVRITKTSTPGPTSPVSRLDLSLVDRCRRQMAGEQPWSVYAKATANGGFTLEWTVNKAKTTPPAGCGAS